MPDNPNLEKPPVGWERVKLGDVCEIVLGQSPPSATYRKSPEGLPFFQGKADFGEVNPKPTTWCVAPKKIAEPGDILISVRAPVGPTNVANERCCIGRGLAALRPRDRLDRDFLLASLKFHETEISDMSSGSTFKAITGRQLREIEFPIPPLAEQRRIVARLNAQMAVVERAKQTAREILDAAEALNAAIVRDLMPYLGHEIADFWKWAKLGEVCEITLGQSPPSDTYRKSPDGLPFFQGKADFGEMNPKPTTWCIAPKKTAEPGDVLISVRAPVGPTNVANERCCIGRGLAALRPRDGLDRDFLLAGLKFYETEIAAMSSGSTFKAITGRQLREIAFPIPPLDEQRRIVAILNERSVAARKMQSAARDGLDAVEAMPSALLRRALGDGG